jgi:hypothetical protein
MNSGMVDPVFNMGPRFVVAVTACEKRLLYAWEGTFEG